MTLTKAGIGKEYILCGIWLPQDVTRRLQMLGMTLGSRILVLNRKRSGSVIIKVRGTRFALGEHFAQGMDVEERSHD